jgi:hypothetical protein
MCEEYLRLFKAYRYLGRTEMQAADELVKDALSDDAGAFRQGWIRCEAARLATKRARRALDAHTAGHSCIERTLTA